MKSYENIYYFFNDIIPNLLKYNFRVHDTENPAYLPEGLVVLSLLFTESPLAGFQKNDIYYTHNIEHYQIDIYKTCKSLTIESNEIDISNLPLFTKEVYNKAELLRTYLKHPLTFNILRENRMVLLPIRGVINYTSQFMYCDKLTERATFEFALETTNTMEAKYDRIPCANLSTDFIKGK